MCPHNTCMRQNCSHIRLRQDTTPAGNGRRVYVSNYGGEIDEKWWQFPERIPRQGTDATYGADNRSSENCGFNLRQGTTNYLGLLRGIPCKSKEVRLEEIKQEARIYTQRTLWNSSTDNIILGSEIWFKRELNKPESTILSSSLPQWRLQWNYWCQGLIIRNRLGRRILWWWNRTFRGRIYWYTTVGPLFEE